MFDTHKLELEGQQSSLYTNNTSSNNVSLTTPVNNTHIITLDHDDIPLVLYGGNAGVQRNLVTVANFSDFFYQKSNSSGDIEFTRAFLNNVNWLANKAKLVTHPFHELYRPGIKIST